jgi:signal transduction histidine kinase
MDSRATEFGVQLDLYTEEDSGVFEADPQAIRSMLVNLLENSLDACRIDTKKMDHKVALHVNGDSDNVHFKITDNGIGMDQETKEKAFTLFFSSKGTEGTGLGLFVSNRIAKTHGGLISIESEAGTGTSFLVTIPRVKELGEDIHQMEVDSDGST